MTTSMPDAPSSATERAPMLGGRFADPLIRALAVFLAGMVLLLALDLISEPSGRAGEDIAIDRALSGTDHALATVVGDIGEDTPGSSDAGSAERRERAQSAAFFVEQANLAWRRGEVDSDPGIEQDRGAVRARPDGERDRGPQRVAAARSCAARPGDNAAAAGPAAGAADRDADRRADHPRQAWHAGLTPSRYVSTSDAHVLGQCGRSGDERA